MALDVKPTRSALLEVRKKIKLSQSGYAILKKKRDGLIVEFFRLLSRARQIRAELVAAYRQADADLREAIAWEGQRAVAAAAFARTAEIPLELSALNLMGVVVPRIKADLRNRRIDQQGVGMINLSFPVEDAADAFEVLLEKILVAAEVETAIRRLLDEIERTKRRVNALEFRVIPQLKEAEDFIRLRLEEMEREATFRLKRIKAKAEAQQHQAGRSGN